MLSRTWSSTETSHSMKSASPPADRIASSSLRPRSRCTSTIATRAPSAAKSRDRGLADARGPAADPGGLPAQPSAHGVAPAVNRAHFSRKPGRSNTSGLTTPSGRSRRVERDDPAAHRAADVAEQLVRPGDAVRGQQDVLELAEPVRRNDRFLGEAVDGRPGDPAVAQARRRARPRQRSRPGPC